MPSHAPLITPAGDTDPTADVPQHESELTALLAHHLTKGVTHRELLAALLNNFSALARVHHCCTAAAGRSALQLGGQLLATTFERPANAPIH